MKSNHQSLPNLYLASQSPRRRQTLEELTAPFQVISSPYQENAEEFAHLVPAEQAAKLASLKAFHAARNLSEGLVIGADTIVVLEDRVLGKPKDRDDARQMLQSLSGRPHQVITGLAIVNVDGLVTRSRAETTRVFFRKLSDADIVYYTNTKEPYDKAGAYAIQGHAGLFVERIEGCYFNVVGFPVVAFSNLLKETGYDLLEYIRRSGAAS